MQSQDLPSQMIPAEDPSGLLMKNADTGEKRIIKRYLKYGLEMHSTNLMKSRMKNNQAKVCKFDRDRGREIDDEMLKEFALNIQSRKAMQKLDLSSSLDKEIKSLSKSGMWYDYTGKITDKGLINFSKTLKNLSCLKDLQLSFAYCEEITDEGVKSLIHDLKRLTCLESISFDFAS